jgi:hypothetical protein
VFSRYGGFVPVVFVDSGGALVFVDSGGVDGAGSGSGCGNGGCGVGAVSWP